MRYTVPLLTLLLAACGGSDTPDSIPDCNQPAPILDQLVISPETAEVGSYGGQIEVEISWEVVSPDSASAFVVVLDSNGEWVEGLEQPDYQATYTTVLIDTTLVSRYTIQVSTLEFPNMGACMLSSNILSGTFEVVAAANVQNNNSVTSGAILGSPTFDVTQIDFSSVSFGSVNDQYLNAIYYQDVNGDGNLDWIFKFNRNNIQIECCDSALILHGKTYNGTAFASLINIENGLPRELEK